MDTYMELRAYGDGAEEALEKAEQQIQGLDSLLSVTAEGSEVYAINHSGGTPTAVSQDTEAVLKKALELGKTTGGALAVTMYPVSRAWGFTTGEYQVPSETELETLLSHVDDSQVTVEDGTVTIPAEAEVDLGAVAKGYAGDLTAELLKEAGVTSALLNLGSSTIRTIGTKPDGSNWRIAIQDPQDSEGYAGVVELGEGAVDTSGGYQRYFTGEDGTVYWHILDPSTGYPAKNGLISVTVVSQDAFTGDGLSTALFVMGLDKAIDYWRQQGDFEFVLIGDDGALYVSEGVSFTPMGSYENAEITVVSREG
jgi:thiamine biosynthesis lipoprotein